MRSDASRPGLFTIGIGVVLLGTAVVAELMGLFEPGLGAARHFLALLGVAMIGAAVWGARTEESVGAGGCLALSAWFGLWTGFVEVGQRLLMKAAFDMEVRQPEEYVWLVPACYGAVFLLAGVAAVVLAGLRGRRVRLQALVFVAVLLLAWTQLMLHVNLDDRAALLLALGVAVPISRGAGGRGVGLARVVRWTLPVLVVVVAALAAWVPLARGMAESRATAELPSPGEGAPNVLLVVLDTVRADHLQSYGYARATTPVMDQLAADGVRFEHAFSTAPWTLPSHVTMFTGLYHHQMEADWGIPMSAGPRTLAEVLAARGYATGGFVGNIAYCSAEWGLDRGFQRYEDQYLTPGIILWSTVLGGHVAGIFGGRRFIDAVRNDAATITDRFLAWSATVEERPFFGFLNYYDAHGLYFTEEPYQTMFGPKSPLLGDWSNGRKYPPRAMKGFVDAYDGCLAFIDHHLGRLVDNLRGRGVLDNTLLIVTADHGEHFGERGGLTGHGNTVYPALLHAPLILHFPRQVPTGTQVADFVSLRDLPATILDLVDAEAALPGQSLVGLWAGAGAGRPTPSPILAEVRPGVNRPVVGPLSGVGMRTLIEDGLQYVRNGNGSQELFNLAKDPGAAHNLIRGEKGKAEAARLRQKMRELMRR